MSSVQIDGQDFKRCMKCGEWTNYDDLMYVPPTVKYDQSEFDRLHDKLISEKDERGYNVVVDNEDAKAFGEYCGAAFGLDVCAACGILSENTYRSPMVTI